MSPPRDGLNVIAFRRILMVSSLAATALLIVLSIIGAFIGKERATDLFNSAPMAAYWVVLLALLAAGLAAFRVMTRRIGLGIMHLGCVLILAGAMWASPAGHRLRSDWLGDQGVRKGHMVIDQGGQSDEVYGPGGTIVGRLDFALKLKRFWVDYYPSVPEKWTLRFVRMVAEADGKEIQGEQEVDWAADRPVTLPDSDIELTVLDYQDNSLYQPDADGVIRATLGEEAITLSARPGATGRFERAALTLEAAGLFQMPAHAGMPPVICSHVVVKYPDGRQERHLALDNPALARQWASDGLVLELRPPNYNPGAALPALHVRLRRGQEEREDVLAVDARSTVKDGYDWWALDALYPSKSAWRWAGSPCLLLENPRFGMNGAKDFYSRLVAIRDDRELPETEKVIEVNDPLHYGGYHFYQNDYDKSAWRYSIIGVVRDSGLWVVYAGFILLMAGSAAHFWLRPAWRALRGRAG